MKKIINLILVIVTVLAIITSVFTMPVSAANDTIISFSKNDVAVGDTVTVSVTVSVDSMYSTNINLNYDEDVLTYVSGASNGGAGLAQIVEFLSGESKKTYEVIFKAKKAGSCNISATGTVGSQKNENEMAEDVVLSGASANMSVKDLTLSTNADLSSITVSAGSLSPRFSKSTTSYVVNVKKSVEECKVWVTTVDYGATVEISGSPQLKVGANKRVITVTAPSGAQKEYVITVNRSNIDDVVSDTSSVESDDSDTSSETDSSDVSSSEESDSSEDATSSDIEEEQNPLETVIDGMPYIVIDKLSKISLPNGFKVAKKLYNGENIEIACDEERNYELFYLKSLYGVNPVPYTYDEEQNKFSRVQIITQGENKYIIAELPDKYILPNEYYNATANIGEFKVKCYASTSEELIDMYYIYCFFDGKYNMYRYDSIEGILQRSPEVMFIQSDSKEAAAVQEGKEDSFSARFNRLSGNSKTIVVCVLIAIIGVIVLIVLLIIKFIRRRASNDYNNQVRGQDFDDINISKNFEILTDDEENE